MLQTGQGKGQIARSNAPSTDFTDDVLDFAAVRRKVQIQINEQIILNANDSPMQTPLSKRNEYKMAASN